MALTNWYSWSPAQRRGQQRRGEAEENNPLPLSDAQLGIWFAQSLDPASPAYNLAEYLEIAGPIDAALFEAALRQAVHETEALRVRFVDGSDGPQQVIDAMPDWSMSFIDVSTAAAPQAAAERWMRADLATPTDLACGPLFAYALLKAAPDRFFWYSRHHHIVMDGFSFALVAQRVADLYTAMAGGRTADACSFGSLTQLLEDDAGYRESKRFEEDRHYWLDCLADPPEPLSLSDRPRAKPPGFIRRTCLLPTSDIEHLQSVANRTGSSLPQLATAAVAIFVHRLTGSQDVV